MVFCKMMFEVNTIIKLNSAAIYKFANKFYDKNLLNTFSFSCISKANNPLKKKSLKTME